MLKQAVCNAKEVADIELMEAEVKFYVASMVLEELEKKCRAYDYELLKAYEEKRSSLIKAFSIMNLLPETNPFRVWLEDLLRMSMTFAQSQRDGLYRRRHNSFIRHYVLRQDIEAIADRQNINEKTVRMDIEHVLDKMMVFAFGIDGLKPELDDFAPRPSTARRARRTGQFSSDDGTTVHVESFARRTAARWDEFFKATAEVIPEFNSPVYAGSYSKRHALLDNLFSSYNGLKPDEPARDLVDRLLVLHQECADYSQNERLTRRHQVFKMKYIENVASSVIARTIGVSTGTVYLDVKKTIRDIMLLAFGMKQTEETKED
ncbi:MAG: hypothetical protein GX249_03680 [Firmicutes bacterium]|jgi:hypothetical protein|nr:hypothetical protein [Bacillota bacterium]